MALEAYSPCPCGSGKKFKWCCQPIHVEIDKAFRQEADGQHEAALKTMQQVVAEHGGNPEAWGRHAQLLYQNGKIDEAENALQKAFEINPNYPFGYLLRGMFRQNEGEVAGALALFRKATEAYDPEAHDILSQLFSMIAECQLRLGRPVAGRAALKLAQHYQPANEELRAALDELFSGKANFPACAGQDYAFHSPPASAPAERRQAWDKALAGAATGRLADAASAFAALTEADPNDLAAWFNLGLVRAWLGENQEAVEALDRAVALEPDETKAGRIAALGEVLRLGQGMEDQSDHVEHSYLFPIQEPQRLAQALQEWQRKRRLVVLPTRPEEEQAGILTALVIEQAPALAVDPNRPQFARLAASLLILGNRLRLWSVKRDSLEQVREELQQLAGPGLGAGRPDRRCANFTDILAETLVFPVTVPSEEAVETGVREEIEKYFEESWLHKPLVSLGGVAPVDAAGHTTLKKKLLGVIQFLQECAATAGRPYDFDRLRRKLGLAGGATPAAAAGAGPDIAAMSAAELAALDLEALADEPLEQAYQSALKLDARDLAGRFARAVVARPARADRPDRYPFYSHLVQLSLNEGNTDAALDLLNEAEKADCEHNEGRRRNDYELRRGQLHARRGETDSAQDLFDRLIERVPGELKYRGSAAEAMLAAKQADRALRFAEQGLAKAREKNDRDSEAYFMELAAAAKKQKG